MNEKPVELMSPAEREAYFKARHAALLAGDDGILPSGKTCREEREEYEALCATDAARTQPDTTLPPGLAVALTESELPLSQQVAPAIEAEANDPEIANKRCC